MARENKATVPAVISNQEILAEINLISQIQQIETRLAVEPDSIRFAQLADAYLGIGDFDHAITLCEKGLKVHPQYDTGTLVLAKSYYLSGNKKKAREVLQNFLISNPASLAGRKLLGDLSLEEDDVAGTVSHYRIALRFDPINRQIIQTLVDLKDKYQKIKESKAEEEEEEDVKPVPKIAAPKAVMAEKPAEKIPPPAVEKPVAKAAPPKEESKLDSFIEDAIQPAEDKIEFKPLEIKPSKTEPVIAKPAEKVKTEEKTGEFSPAYTDENGIMFFYDDDEVSFDQYKKRLDLQKAGKALILERSLLDQKLIEKGVRSAAKTQTAEEEDAFAKTDSAFDMDIAPKETVSKPPQIPEAFEKAETKKFTSFEDHIDASMAMEEEELLTAAEQEAALSEIEISYKDYLDILTNEDELLEALFQEEHEASMEEAEDRATGILRDTLGEEKTGFAEDAGSEEPIAYLDYVQSLEDDKDIAEATLAMAPSEDEGVPVSLADFSMYLDQSDDVIDFNTYSLLLEAEGGSGNSLWEAAVKEEPALKYDEYLSSASETEKAEAALEVKQTQKAEEITLMQPVVEETIAEKIIEPPAKKIETPVQKEEAKQAQPPQPEEKSEEAEEIVYGEAFEDEEVNPQDATPELVEKLAARGQFGTAYKVCKMLKVKNPTDAKVDRKILELKRLYVWSSQMVG